MISWILRWFGDGSGGMPAGRRRVLPDASQRAARTTAQRTASAHPSSRAARTISHHCAQVAPSTRQAIPR
jgi:hypothetical protein